MRRIMGYPYARRGGAPHLGGRGLAVLAICFSATALAAPPETPPIGFVRSMDGALRFGESVSADGGFLAIGSPTAGDHGNEPGEIRVLRFLPDGRGGFTAEGRARIGAWRAGDHFGATVAIRHHADGLRLAVGADGADAVEVYSSDVRGHEWSHDATITPLRADPASEFGCAIAVSADGRTIVVGSRRADGGGLIDSGAAHLFALDDASGAWKELACIGSPRPRMSGWFGASVAVHGTMIAIGAPGEESGGHAGAGAVHLYERTASGSVRWCGTLESPEPLPGSWFGSCASVAGDRLAVGEPRARRDGIRCGAAWVWSLEAPLTGPRRIDPAAPQEGMGFGQSLALADRWLAVGAPGHDRVLGAERVEDSGRVDLFDLDHAFPTRVLGAPQGAASSLLGAAVAILREPSEERSFVLAGHLFVEEESTVPSPGVAIFTLSGLPPAAWQRHPPDTSARASASTPPRTRRR